MYMTTTNVVDDAMMIIKNAKEIIIEIKWQQAAAAAAAAAASIDTHSVLNERERLCEINQRDDGNDDDDDTIRITLKQTNKRVCLKERNNHQNYRRIHHYPSNVD
jgi:hypothetical protein